MKLSTKVPLKIYAFDVDYMGIVHNITYLKWMEETRSDFLTPYYSMETAVETGISPGIMNSHLHYLTPLRMGDDAYIEMKVTDISGAKWSVEFEITSSEGVHFRSEQDGMFYDSVNKRPTRTPKHLRELFKEAKSIQD